MNKRIKWNYDLVKKFIEDKGYELLSNEYINTKHKLKLRCPNGHEFEITFANFKEKNKCKICEGREYNYDYVKKYLLKEGYELLSDKYENNHKKILIKHKECSHVFKMTFANFKFGQRCPKCAGVEKLSLNEIKFYIESFGYELLSKEYVNNKNKLNIKCDKGHIFKMSISSFKRGRRCPECKKNKISESQKLSYNHVKEYVESKGYELLTNEYKNTRTKLLLKCKDNHEFYISLDNLKKDKGCPKCKNNSKGEIEIIKYLDGMNINYIYQHTFENCKHKQLLRFDFYLKDYNILIEYDGIQHFKAVSHFGGEEGFKETKIRDEIKNDYAKNNNIKLIRIPYWEIKNINKILNDLLKAS